MKFRYALLESAQIEYEEALNWYLQRSILAAEDFIADFEQTIELIRANPYRWRNEYGPYHELVLKKFPYSIVYIIKSENRLVIVTAVYHAKRNPKKKYRSPDA